MDLINKESITSNMIWRLFERFGAQGVSFVVSVVLARLLDPSIYGTIALVTVFTSILQVFVDGGLGNSLIQKKDADDLDFSTVFYFNIFFCFTLYILLFWGAPFIADFYGDKSLTLVIRVLGLIIIISGIKNIQQSYVSRHMMFKRFFYATLGGTIGAAFLGIIMAYNGFGVWALVVQNLFNATVDTIILWITVKWRPQRKFSFQRLKTLFSYGWKLLIASLIDAVYEDMRSLVIGKMYSSSDLGYYNRGKQFPALITSNINTAIDSVLFPSMSQEQSNLAKVKAMTSRAIKTGSYILFPLMTGLAVCAEPIVNIVLSNKWLPCVPFLRIFCFGMALNPILLANLNAIKAIGKSDIYLKLEIIRKVVGFATLLLLMWFGVKAIAYSYLLNCILNMVVNSWPNKRLLKYGYFQQVKDVAPAIFLSAAMGVPVYLVTKIGLNDWLTLALQIPTGVAIYATLSALVRAESFSYVITIVRSLTGRKHKERIADDGIQDK